MNIGMTLDTNKIVSFQLGDDIFGIDIMAVREIIRLDNLRELPDAPDYFYGLINMRGEIIPAINFKKIFGFTGFDFQTNKDVILCKVEDKVFGLVIDRVIKVADYSKAQIGPPPKLTSRVQAALVTGVVKIDNELISIIDIFPLFSQKGQNFLSYDGFKKEIFQSSMVEHYFSKKDLDKLKSLLMEIGLPFNEITRKGILEYIVKIAVRKGITVEAVIEAVRQRNTAYVPDYLFYKNTNHVIFYRDNDFLTLQKILLEVILPQKRKKNQNSLKIWVINESSMSEDAYSLLFILAVLFEDEFDLSWDIISSGENLDDLNASSTGEFKAKSLNRITSGIKKYLFDTTVKQEVNSESENDMETGAVKPGEKKNEEIHLKKEWKEKLHFDLFFPHSKIGKKEVDLIYAPGLLSKLPQEYQKMSMNKFYSSLNTGGALLCGFFENFSNVPHSFKTYMLGNRTYYYKG